MAALPKIARDRALSTLLGDWVGKTAESRFARKWVDEIAFDANAPPTIAQQVDGLSDALWDWEMVPARTVEEIRENPEDNLGVWLLLHLIDRRVFDKAFENALGERLRKDTKFQDEVLREWADNWEEPEEPEDEDEDEEGEL